MKRLILLCIITNFSFVVCSGQPTVRQGSTTRFTIPKQLNIKPLATTDGHVYFAAKVSSRSPEGYTLLGSNANGNLLNIGEFEPTKGWEAKVVFYTNSIVALGDRLVVLVERRDKDAGTNSLTAQVLNSDGTLEDKKVVIGSFPYGSVFKPGDWWVAISPDGKHLAAIGRAAHTKDAPDKMQYYFLDSDLKQTAKGAVTMPGEKSVFFGGSSVYTSNKGDMYLVENQTYKMYSYPVIYKIGAGSSDITIIPTPFADNDISNSNYHIGGVNNTGGLTVAGYFVNRKKTKEKGTWYFNSDKPNDFKTVLSETPLDDLLPLGLVENGNTTFLIGQQITEEKTGTQVEEYNYKNKSILITGFDNESGDRKFEMPIDINWSAKNFRQDMYPAYGIVNGRLAVVYNDMSNKYYPNTYNYKLPVFVSVTNDGLMEAPLQFEKDLKLPHSGFTFYPQYFAATNGSLLLLSGDGGGSLKAVVVK